METKGGNMGYYGQEKGVYKTKPLKFEKPKKKSFFKKFLGLIKKLLWHA